MASKNIVLIGFMGTGKTSVGKILARKLNRLVIDADEVIEAKTRRKIGDIFEKEGEPYFRALEKETIGDISRKEGVVITTGGGAVLDPANLEALKKNGWIVALMAEPTTILRRVKRTLSRPLLKGENVLSRIEELLRKRKPLYEQSDFQCATDGRTAAQVAECILSLLEGKLS